MKKSIITEECLSTESREFHKPAIEDVSQACHRGCEVVRAGSVCAVLWILVLVKVN